MDSNKKKSFKRFILNSFYFVSSTFLYESVILSRLSLTTKYFRVRNIYFISLSKKNAHFEKSLKLTVDLKN